jgi:hypothetical protein
MAGPRHHLIPQFFLKRFANVTGIEASRDLAKMVFVMRWRLPEHGKAHAGAMQR